MFYKYKFLFSLSLILGSLISISSNSWLGMWMGLEINLLSFIPIIQEKNNSLSTESSLKYFLSQALASIIFLMSVIMLMKNFLIMVNLNNYFIIMLNSSLLMKMGMAPFHFWFPEVIEGLNWINSMILLTWQKITPMILVMFNLNNQTFFFLIMIFSMLISAIMGFNQISLRKLMAYSSINHMSWMISAMLISETIWFYYFITYFILTINIILIFYKFNIYFYNQLLLFINKNYLMKFFFSFNFLSLGGLPPFLGFFPKWLSIQSMIFNNWLFLAFLMVILTLLTLFFYVKLIFNIMIFNSNEINYFNPLLFNVKNILIINFFSLISLLLIPLTLNFS
uniref:NADH-ubiquinone oxidoreductase chain 2 n=1 Tax=Staphylinidae sp. BMNH 1274658 TaxID=1796587 RepID=A0A126TFX1_9COLE|nr:NADH dehydrogenase subunit 2 [Staphylinidae sp. BMNH 1274658]